MNPTIPFVITGSGDIYVNPLTILCFYPNYPPAMLEPYRTFVITGSGDIYVNPLTILCFYPNYPPTFPEPYHPFVITGSGDIHVKPLCVSEQVGGLDTPGIHECGVCGPSSVID